MFSIKKQNHRVVTLTLVLRSSCVITNAPPVIASTCFGYHGQAYSLIFFEVCMGAHGLTLTGGMLLTGLWCLLSLNEKQARLRSDFSDSQPRLSHTFTLLYVWDVQKLIACFVF